MCGVFAEFERSIIRERINAGLARARSNGKKLGRPKVDPEVEEAIRQALERGNKGMRKIAREMAIGVSVVQRISSVLSKMGNTQESVNICLTWLPSDALAIGTIGLRRFYVDDDL